MSWRRFFVITLANTCRFERGREIIGLNNLVQHLVTEHHSASWQDEEFPLESAK
jgi:hypothetical protein